MKIFSSKESVIQADGPAKKMAGKAKKRAAGAISEKGPISEREVREKIAAHVETSNAAKSKILKQNSQQLGAGFMSEKAKKLTSEISSKGQELGPEQAANEGKDGLKEAHLLMSDVKLNDPKDPNTQEKLKSVLSKGAFNFNPRERETLDKILNGN
ncbi:MAG: hypothetical protein KBD76_04825 [Bacteriovorax sp.]|jgi:Ulp1 family protease|nr:hypothetical protein [Bacteriovorax sp.]